MEKDRLQKIDELFREFDMGDKPGVVVGVTQNGKTEYSKAFGMANLEYDLPLTLDSVLQVGSVSKQFTAFAILLLSEEGKIDLNAPVKTYLDYFPDFDNEITVRHMIHHVSGLRGSISFMMANGIAEEDVFTNDLDITIAKKQQALNFEPDTFYTYCNLSYSLLAQIVVKVTGKSFRAYVDETIFKPLKMNSSFFHDTKFELIKNKAEAYTVQPEEILNSPIVHASYGSTNLFTTIKDVIKWAEELMNPQIFSKEIVEKAFTPHECKNGFKTGYGFGFGIHDYKGKCAVEHGGSDAGYRAHIWMIPKENLGILLLSNRSDFDSDKFARGVVDIVLHIADDSSVYEKIPKDEDISGTYYVDKGVNIYSIIKTEEGTFVSTKDMKTEVFKKGKSLYIIPESDMEISFSEKGRVIFLTNGNLAYGTKINPIAITAEDKANAGKYLGIEFDAVHDVVFTDDTLFLCNNKTGEMPFEKYDNGIYIDMVLGMATIKFAGDTMYLSSNRAVDVKFKNIKKDKYHDRLDH